MDASVLRQIDYFERAKRVEEVPLLEEQGKRDAEARREQYNEQQADRVSMTRAIRRATGGSGARFIRTGESAVCQPLSDRSCYRHSA